MKFNGNIIITTGDITEETTDVIVNSANPLFIAGSGVCGAIHRIAGPELEKATQELVPCPVGEARHTAGYNLPAKYIIHTVAQKYHLVVYEKSREELLADCYRNSLNLAHSLGITSISFPSLGTGVNGWPHNESAKIMLTTIQQWLSENKSDITIRILLLNKETENIYVKKSEQYTF